MGVHTTFVRSVDLDEWTQRQIDAMRLGGNANAREYFRKHGLTDMNTKIEKKYKSKAAQSYRKVLAELVEAEAVKRGEGSAPSDAAAASENGSGNGNSLMDSLHAADQQEAAKAAAASTKSAEPAVAVSRAVQASQLHAGKGKLITPPSSGNAPKIVLRKPSSGSSLGMLKKKPAGAKKTTALKVNKLSSKTNGNSSLSNGGDSSDDGMEDIEATVKKAREAEAEEAAAAETAAKVAAQQEEAEQARLLAAKLEQAAKISPPPEAAPPPKPPAPTVVAPKQTMADSLAKMKAEQGDFFGGL